MKTTTNTNESTLLRRALHELGRNQELRDEMMKWLVAAESRLSSPCSVRDQITGPIIDALHEDNDLYEKTLADGTKIKFFYRTKIAREFVLSKEQFPSHVWEPQTTRLLQYLAHKTVGDVLIGGAYFGDHAVLIGKQLQGSLRMVHCFEPNVEQAAMLRQNAALNGLKSILVEEKGLWSDDNVKLKLEGFDSFANTVIADKEGEGFETITIDSYCREKRRHLGVVMLDIEGAEYQALQGARNMIASNKPAIVFEIHRDYVDWDGGLASTPIVSLLLAFGYQIFALRDFNAHQEMGSRCIELIPVDTVYLDGPPHGFNMLAIADTSLVASELFRIVPGVSPKLIRHKSPALHHPLDGLPD